MHSFYMTKQVVFSVGRRVTVRTLVFSGLHVYRFYMSFQVPRAGEYLLTIWTLHIFGLKKKINCDNLGNNDH